MPDSCQQARFAPARRVGAEGILLLLAIFLHKGMPYSLNASAVEGHILLKKTTRAIVQ